MALTAGTRLGVYEITAQIGEGGMGQVYRATDTKLKRQVALKTLPSVLAADVDRLARFQREAEVLASLNHPNIAHIHGLEESGGITALVMELVEGDDLSQRIARGAIPLDEALPIARQIAEALEAAHDQGIIHRDLKPANIKVRPDGTVKVLDFGLAKAFDPLAPVGGNATMSPTLSIHATHSGIILGTAAYMSPEQARGKAVDKRSDVWAFGCVLYEMLTGRRAFDGATSLDALAAILDREPAWNALPQTVPAGVRRLLRRCLQKDAKRRLRDIADARLDLDEAEHSRDTSTSVAGVTPRNRTWRLVGIGGALFLSGALAVLAVWSLRTRSGSMSPSVATSADDTFRLVVLPFENLSRQPSDEWLAGAFSDSLTLGLRDAENIVLVNRERLLEFDRDRKFDPLQLSRALGVKYYVSGSYQRVGDDLKVVARLVEADAGTIRLQESFTDRFASLLQLEENLARRFAAALQRSPTVAPHARTASLAAYQAVAQANDLYLAGRYRDAIQRLNSAVAQDAKYADAWALLGKSYARLSNPNSVDRSAGAGFLREALRASQRAVELEPSLYDAQVALAATYQQMGQVESWRIAAQKAIDLSPQLPEAYVILGDSYGPSPAFGCARKRDPQLAERAYRKALQLNPFFAGAHERWITDLFWSGRENEALRATDEALRLMPDNVSLVRLRAVVWLWLGRADELEQELHQIAATAGTYGTYNLYDWELAALSLLRGHAAEAAAFFKPVIARDSVVLREIDTGRLYANVGRLSEAAAHLEHAFALDGSCAVFVGESPAFARYRNEPVLSAVVSKYLQKGNQ